MVPNAAESTTHRRRGLRPAAAPICRQAHINPATGLAADYLNHVNEAIMLLEMLAATPDGVHEFCAWRPRGYRDYFETAPFPNRAAAIAAYEAADPLLRGRLDRLTESMTEVLAATREVMQSNPPSPAIGMLANRAARWLASLAAEAGAVINGDQLRGNAARTARRHAGLDAPLEQ